MTLPSGSFLQIGYPGIDLVVGDQPADLAGGGGLHRESHVGMAGAEWGGQRGDDRRGSGNRRKAKSARQSPAQARDFLSHGARITDDPACPVENTLTFRGETLESGTALHQQDAEPLFELLHSGRERLLGNVAELRGPAEMPLASQGKEEFEAFDHRHDLMVFIPEFASRNMRPHVSRGAGHSP